MPLKVMTQSQEEREGWSGGREGEGRGWEGEVVALGMYTVH